MEKLTVTYLEHSAWAVETFSTVFIFDYSKPPKEDSFVDLIRLQSKPVYFFSSHIHGDHYSKKLNKAVSQYANMKFITGGFSSVFDNSIAILLMSTRNSEICCTFFLYMFFLLLCHNFLLF